MSLPLFSRSSIGMLSNAFRSVCRLRTSGVFESNYASLDSLGQLAVSPHHQGSIVEKLLLKPVVSVSDSYSPYSIHLDSPLSSLSSLGSPSENASNWSLEDEKSFDNKYGIYELDSLICEEFYEGDELEDAVQCCSRVKEEQEVVRVEVDPNASFHSFIDELIATVKEEIEREQALEEAVLLDRAAKIAADVATVAAAAATPLTKKDIDAGLDGSANNRKRIAIDDLEIVPVLRKRKRTFTLEEMALRKRNQNRRAAQRYREKLVKVKGEQMEECTELEEKNDHLRANIVGLENEIERFKMMLLAKAEEAKAEKAI